MAEVNPFQSVSTKIVSDSGQIQQQQKDDPIFCERKYETMGIPNDVLKRYGELKKLVGLAKEPVRRRIGEKMPSEEEKLYEARIEIALLEQKYTNIKTAYQFYINFNNNIVNNNHFEYES